MKKTIFLLFFLCTALLNAQTDYSNSWEDFYSYNNVKDFIKIEETIYALTDNAVFIYNIDTKEIQKLSSIQGLSGKTTTAIYYSNTFKRLVIGYENGLVEVVDENGAISIAPDIVNFNQSGEKSINHISGLGNKLYLSTPFAIVVYDIENLEFGDTYFIGNNSTAIRIYETTILNNKIYAATESGIFTADVSNTNLIDYTNWNANFTGTSFQKITTFNNEIYTASNSNLFKVEEPNLSLIENFSETIVDLNSSSSHLSVALNQRVIGFDNSMNVTFTSTTTTAYNYTLNNAFFEEGLLFLGTKEYGILFTDNIGASEFEEIHPEGPLSNDVFSITTQNQHLWVVYGGYNDIFGPIFKKQGFSHFNGQNWINTPYNPDFPVTDLVSVIIDPSNENKVYICSFGATNNVNSVSTGGLLVVEDNVPTNFYNHLNSDLEDILSTNPTTVTIRISNGVFDLQGNLWVTNQEVDKKIKKLSPSGEWSGVDLSVLERNFAPGLSDIIVDKNNTIWVGTRRNGIYIYNENGNRKKSLITNATQGALPDLRVNALAVDSANKIWIGTLSGLVVYNNAGAIFDSNADTTPIIIEENGVGERLLGDQSINTIAVDGADNKWFGTDSGGVTYTNPNGDRTLANFNTENSPLPSNKILKIKVDTSTGKVFFATNKGIVAYNSEVAPFGTNLGEVYAYPNPALKQHQTVTIDGRNGTHLPKGTNVKILDVAGNLVHETNVVEGQELQGGKVVWNKTNLAGKKVASGIYIVLLSNEDNSETSTTKIAIVN